MICWGDRSFDGFGAGETRSARVLCMQRLEDESYIFLNGAKTLGANLVLHHFCGRNWYKRRSWFLKWRRLMIKTRRCIVCKDGRTWNFVCRWILCVGEGFQASFVADVDFLSWKLSLNIAGAQQTALNVQACWRPKRWDVVFHYLDGIVLKVYPIQTDNRGIRNKGTRT